jgi:predicted DCC family thiol-disulfide oxidoreductase YuxK
MSQATAEHPIILFDGECNLCNASVDLVMRNDADAVFRFGSLQSEAAERILEPYGRDPDLLGSIILVETDGVYRESAAALRIARRMDGAWPLLYVFIIVPPFIRDAVYRWIARNRYRWFGKRDTCRLPTPEERDRFIE